MADRERDRDRHQLQVIHPQHRYEGGGMKGGMSRDQGPSVSKIIAVLAMLPAGGILLALAGITFIGTLIGLAVATPLFVIFSPVLVPAAITIGLAVMGFLTSGAFGLTALSSLSRVLNYVRQAGGVGIGTGIAEEAKRRGQETAGYLGQKTKEAGQEIQSRAHEGGGRSSS